MMGLLLWLMRELGVHLPVERLSLPKQAPRELTRIASQFPPYTRKEGIFPPN